MNTDPGAATAAADPPLRESPQHAPAVHPAGAPPGDTAAQAASADSPLAWTAGAAPRLLPYGATLFPAMLHLLMRIFHCNNRNGLAAGPAISVFISHFFAAELRA